MRLHGDDGSTGVAVGQLEVRLEYVKIQGVAATAMVVHGDHLEVLSIILKGVAAGTGQRLAGGLILHFVDIEMHSVVKFEVRLFRRRRLR